MDIIADSVLLLTMLSMMIAIKKLTNPLPFYRVSAIFIIGVMLFYAANPVNLGRDIYWIYAVPLYTFFLMGGREGRWWVGLHFVGLTTLLSFPDLFNAFKYTGDEAARVLTSYALTALFTYTMESFRSYYYRQLEVRNDQLLDEKFKLAEEIEVRKGYEFQKEKLIKRLEKTLQENKVLHGLLPICSRCKKIRDDEGEWQQMELYFREHSGADFTHGLCPECGEYMLSLIED